jgi:hypothetical protein
MTCCARKTRKCKVGNHGSDLYKRPLLRLVAPNGEAAPDGMPDTEDDADLDADFRGEGLQ